jgi:beta-lactamase regulating signal transducer with metallopeptidase domain
MECAIVEYLANALWQVPLLVAGVGALLWALGSDVRTRHRVWLAVLAVSLLLPLRGMETGNPATDRIIRIAPAAAPAPSVGAPHGPQMATLAADTDYDVTPIEMRQPAHEFGIVLSCAATSWIVRLYGALFVFFAWRVLRSWIAAQGLLRRSRSIDLAPRAVAIFAQTAEAQNVPLPRLRQSDETVSPVVIGAVRPVLLLPAGFDRLKDDEILAALSHEFAHLARRDYLINLICQIGALPLAWHPAIHYVQKRIRDTREMLCDAAAAQEMASPVRYATCLVAFALRALDSRDAALATQGLSMFDNRILEERILQLTQAPEEPEPSTRLVRLAGASIGLALAVAMALLFHITPTWADTPVAVIAEPPSEPVPLTPQVDLPAIPAAPETPARVAAPAAPAAAPVAKPRHVIHAEGQSEVERNKAELQREAAREQAEREREVAEQQRDEAQRQREATREQVQRQREVAQLQREEARRQRDEEMQKRDRDREVAERERERAEQQRDAAEQQREAAREAMEEARREATEASRAYAAEIKRQVAEAVKVGQTVHEVDMEKIKQEIAQASAAVHTPEFKAQMVELQSHIQQLHDHMAELRAQMKALNHEVEKSVNSPM